MNSHKFWEEGSDTPSKINTSYLLHTSRTAIFLSLLAEHPDGLHPVGVELNPSVLDLYSFTKDPKRSGPKGVGADGHSLHHTRAFLALRPTRQHPLEVLSRETLLVYFNL
jgi:hypothetical protein